MNGTNTTVAGTAELVDIPPAARAINRRVYGMWRFAGLLLIPLTLCVLILLVLLTAMADSVELKYAFAVGCVVAAIFCASRIDRIRARALRRRWTRRGVPTSYSISYSVTPCGLRVTSEFGDGWIYWRAVNELAVEGDYWIFIGPMNAYHLPRHFFGNPVLEETFVTSALDHMKPDARERSTEARRLLTMLSLAK
jgi:hypothetical protein